MTYGDAVKYLDSFVNYEKRAVDGYSRSFKLERMRRLLALLEDPHKGRRFIHIAGTKGKGSTAAIAASILREAGLCVGLYISPHLSSFRERIVVNGEMIEKEELAGITEIAMPHFESLRIEGLSFFEVYTAIAFLFFKSRDIDIGVLEVGLGGRLDATNVVDSAVSVITPISFDHTHILGSSLCEIAAEKAGIIKEDSICISSPQREEALLVIKEACRTKKTRLYIVGRDILIDDVRVEGFNQYFNVLAHFQEYPLLELPLLGEHQVENAASAVGAVDALGSYGIFISQDAVRKGVSGVRWPGRMEIVGECPYVVLDGAQNAASAQALANAVERHFGARRFVLVLGISADKDIKGICDTLCLAAHSVILTAADNPRAADPHLLKQYVSGRPAIVVSDAHDALLAARDMAGRDGLVVVAGSLFLVGEIREAVYEIQSR